jgi:hypothetical protein
VASDGFGFVSGWYDQTGNARHAVQTTAAAQPRIVNDGVIETMGGRPAIVWSGAQVLTNQGSTFGNVRNFSSVMTFARGDAIESNRCVWGNRSAGGSQGRIFRTTLTTAFMANISAGSVSQPYVNDTPVVASAVNSAAANLLMRLNGGADSSSISTGYATTSNPMTLGTDGRGQEFFVGATGDMTFFHDALLEKERRFLERDMGAFFNITVAALAGPTRFAANDNIPVPANDDAWPASALAIFARHRP